MTLKYKHKGETNEDDFTIHLAWLKRTDMYIIRLLNSICLN